MIGLCRCFFFKKEDVDFVKVSIFDDCFTEWGSGGVWLNKNIKTMSKIVVEELDVCCKFFEKVRLTPSPKQRMYVDISHNVFCSNFVIFISYDHKDFHVKTFISDILEEAIKSELFRFGWKVHWPLIEEKKCTLSFVWTPSWYSFYSGIKKMISFYHLFDDFVKHLKIKQYSIKKKRTETKNIIKVYCKSKDTNVSKELDFLNCLYYWRNSKKYGYNLFIIDIILKSMVIIYLLLI